MSYISNDGSQIVTAWRQDLAALIPHATPFDHEGQRFLVFPNAREEARLARNLGVAIPSPIFTGYDWCAATSRRKPWDVQKITAAMLVENPRAYVLNSMGTGKTAAALFACDFLMRTSGVRRVLIVAPLSTLTPVWEAELFMLMPHRKMVVLHHAAREKRSERLKRDASFYIVNHHGLQLLRDELVAKKFDVIIIDELSVFRNKSTNLWKSANTVIQGVPYVWGLTGSPTPSSPTDAWGQMKLLTPARTARSMSQFRDQTMNKITTFKWVPKREANDTVHAQMQPSVRFQRSDVSELPPTSYVHRKVELSPDGARAYKLLYDHMRMSTNQGKTITAVNEGVLRTKLLQVACGYIYADDGTVYELPQGGRHSALLEVVEETDAKVIVFVPFLHAIAGVADYLARHKHVPSVVHGSVSRTVRDRIFTSFQTQDEPKLIVAHPGCMAHGLTLTRANTIVWYAPAPSYEIYEQANARIVRPGQLEKTYIVHLGGTAVERETYRRQETKGKLQGLLLDLFRQQELSL
jgi:SNF2 family DNA or RNA helicase